MTLYLALVTAIFLLTGILYFGWRKVNYSHWQDTISELGEVSGPLSRIVSYGIFLPTGLLLWITAALAQTKEVAGLAACIGVGYFIAALFPCDTGSPIAGSGRQQIHNLGGAVEYIGGAFWLTQVSPELVVNGINVYPIASVILIVGSILLSIPGMLFRGLIQRTMEVILFGALLLNV